MEKKTYLKGDQSHKCIIIFYQHGKITKNKQLTAARSWVYPQFYNIYTPEFHFKNPNSRQIKFGNTSDVLQTKSSSVAEETKWLIPNEWAGIMAAAEELLTSSSFILTDIRIKTDGHVEKRAFMLV